jgi:hypothetical protein
MLYELNMKFQVLNFQNILPIQNLFAAPIVYMPDAIFWIMHSAIFYGSYVLINQ